MKESNFYQVIKESSTYQMILEEGREEGRAEGELKMLLLIGGKRLGEPDETTRAILNALISIERIEALGTLLFEVKSWQELLEKESNTYQIILATGEQRGELKMLLLVGGKRFGKPDEAAQATLDAITSPEQIEALAGRLFEVETWQELLKQAG